MARTDPQVNFRMPADLKDRIELAAKENKRSATAEIVHRLSLSFEKDEIAKEPPLQPRPLPPGVEVDYGAQVWAERLMKPGNRHELENLLAIIRRMIGTYGIHDENDPQYQITMSEPAKLKDPVEQPAIAVSPRRRVNAKGARERAERDALKRASPKTKE